MAFIGQSAPDIRTKLQLLEGLQDYTLQDLIREKKRDRKRTKELSRILATLVQPRPELKKQGKFLRDKRCPAQILSLED